MPTIDFSKYKIAPGAQKAPALPAGNGGAPQIDFSKYKISNNQNTPAPALPAAKPGLVANIASDFNKRVNAGADVIDSKQSLPSKVIQDVGQGAGFVGDIGADVAKAAGSHITGTDAQGNTKSLDDVVGGALDKVAATAPAQAAIQAGNKFATAHPEAAGDIGAAFNIASVLPIGAAADAAGDAAADVAKSAATKTVDAASAIREAATPGSQVPALASSAGRVAEKSATPAVDESGNLAKESILPKATGEPASSEAMKQGIGKTSIPKPSDLHAQYYEQEQKALADSKQDTALGIVGSDAGKAFEKVIGMKNKAGSTMSDELEKIGSIKTDLGKANTSLESELSKNGLRYSSKTKTLVPLSKDTEIPLTSSDTALLAKYSKDLKKLGPNPTVKNLDSFLKRAPDDLKVYKAKNNILGTTNGERIIKNNMSALRQQFSPEESGKALTKYAEARKSYASLSKTIEDGVPFFGKKTSSGDFAKDASLVKSSVQSALNGGKKDFLMKLEALTGEPVIDKAVLALQAMKDAGDYRGASLLETLTEGASKGALPEAPKTIGALAYAIGHKVVSATAKAALGTPFEKTQRFLKSIE